jgi:hypothetical protein
MITYMGHKCTANELAKILVTDRGVSVIEFWGEAVGEGYELMTEREVEQVNEALDKQVDRVAKFMGYWELREKVFSRPDRSDEIHRKLWGDD